MLVILCVASPAMLIPHASPTQYTFSFTSSLWLKLQPPTQQLGQWAQTQGKVLKANKVTFPHPGMDFVNLQPLLHSIQHSALNVWYLYSKCLTGKSYGRDCLWSWGTRGELCWWHSLQSADNSKLLALPELHHIFLGLKPKWKFNYWEVDKSNKQLISYREVGRASYGPHSVVSEYFIWRGKGAE